MVDNIGMTNAEALQCVTINAARAVKLEEDFGSLEVGKMGDVLIMTENALDNISVLEKITNIEPVVKSGKILVTNGKILQ